MRYRRANTPGATYFFTVNLADRKSGLLTEHIDVLRNAMRKIRQPHPFSQVLADPQIPASRKVTGRYPGILPRSKRIACRRSRVLSGRTGMEPHASHPTRTTSISQLKMAYTSALSDATISCSICASKGRARRTIVRACSTLPALLTCSSDFHRSAKPDAPTELAPDL